jgi:hypothetical protein
MYLQRSSEDAVSILLSAFCFLFSAFLGVSASLRLQIFRLELHKILVMTGVQKDSP